MSEFKTDQEEFWAGIFGDEYTDRNQGLNCIASNINLFSKIFANTKNIKSVIEFGANLGLNLIAIKSLLPDTELSAVEINPKAIEELKKIDAVKTYCQSMLDYKVDYKRDLSFTKGVLIHINPDYLPFVYDILYDSSSKYICVAEYYNPIPVEIPYRGHNEKLFKRNFAGELLERFKNLELIDYGFAYHGDNNFSQDDITWFLMEKK